MCISQSQLKRALGELFARDAIACRKVTRVCARPARAGERVETVTGDGSETVNIAAEGDFLVENQTDARERYLVSAGSFGARYRRAGDAGRGWAVYEPRPEWTVRVLHVDDRVLEHLGNSGGIRIEAPWGGIQPVARGDFLVATPGGGEIYRIARKEFGETYRPASPGAAPD